ncbi:hypothetical protein HJC23_001862 [Cyclotella cryptica]|uniref:Uncharacterized protein n=1 Tax=Cyclotella cryptica TaxID=29204 RepID=A0ABD3Q0F3_9STRA
MFSKHAVILFNTIYIALNALGVAFIIWADKLINNSDATVDIGGSEITDDQKNTFNVAYPYFLTLYCITLLVNASTIFAAKSDDYCMVVLGTLWYLLQMAFNIWLSLQMGFTTLLIISVLWFALLLCPHGVFVYEVNKGSMEEEDAEHGRRDVRTLINSDCLQYPSSDPCLLCSSSFYEKTSW